MYRVKKKEKEKCGGDGWRRCDSPGGLSTTIAKEEDGRIHIEGEELCGRCQEYQRRTYEHAHREDEKQVQGAGDNEQLLRKYCHALERNALLV